MMNPTFTTNRILALVITFASWLTFPLAYGQSLDNPSFEDSVFVNGGFVPSGWSNSGLGMGYVSDAHHGSKAVQIWNWYYYGKGWIVNGNAQTLGWGGGTPFTMNDVALTGYYKYELGMNGGAPDSAYCDLFLFKYNTSTQERDTLGYSRKLLGPAAAYTYFETWVSNQNTQLMPDSIVVTFSSSVSGFCDNQSNGECLYLTIDNLALELPVGLPQPFDLTGGVQLHPSPSSGQANVRLPEAFGSQAELQVFGIDGRSVAKYHWNGRSSSVDLSFLPPSVYMWTLKDESGRTLSGKWVRQ